MQTLLWRLQGSSQQYRRKVQDPDQRPQKKQPPLWQHPVVKAVAKNGALLGLGVVLTISIQRWQRSRHSSRE